MRSLKACQGVFCAAAAATLFWRLLQKYFFIDPQTGFYMGSPVWIFPFWIFLLAAWALYRGCPRREPGVSATPPTQSIVLGLASILLGLAVEFSSYEGASDIFYQIHGEIPQQLFRYASVATGVVTGLCFLVLGLEYLTGKSGQRAWKGLLSVSVFWQIAYLIERFSLYTSIGTISDQQLFVLLLVCNLLFLSAHAKTAGGVLVAEGWRQAMGYGLFTSLVGVAFLLPLLLKSGTFPQFSLAEQCVVGAFSLYDGVYGVSLLRTAQESPKESR